MEQQFLSRQIVVLGSPGTRRLQKTLSGGLNRLQHPVWKRARDAIVGTELEQELAAVQLASVIVAVATPAFQRSPRGRSLMQAADERRADVISIERRTSGRVAPWSANVRIDLPQQLEPPVVDALIRQVSEKIRWLERRVSQGVRAPVGRRGRFVMLSYSRDDASLAGRVCEHLSKARIATWEYGDSPRAPTHHGPEIDDAIQRSSVVIVLLTRAWLQSPECRREAEQAAQVGKRCLWLRCGDVQPPRIVEDMHTLDFRPRHRKETLLRLAREALPSRRRPTRPT